MGEEDWHSLDHKEWSARKDYYKALNNTLSKRIVSHISRCLIQMVEYSEEQNIALITAVSISSLYMIYWSIIEICKDYTNRAIRDEIVELNKEIEMLELKLSKKFPDEDEHEDEVLSRRVGTGHEAELDLS